MYRWILRRFFIYFDDPVFADITRARYISVREKYSIQLNTRVYLVSAFTQTSFSQEMFQRFASCINDALAYCIIFKSIPIRVYFCFYTSLSLGINLESSSYVIINYVNLRMASLDGYCRSVEICVRLDTEILDILFFSVIYPLSDR